MSDKVPWADIIRNIQEGNGLHENLELGKWVNLDAENKKIYAEARNIFNLTHNLPEPFQPYMKAAWRNICSRVDFNNKQRNRFIWFFRNSAAAILILMLGMAIQYFVFDSRPPINEFTTVVVPNGQKSKIILPDGSLVLLNSGTTLKYNSSFNHHKRIVRLEKGEAYFNVEKNKSLPFLVYTGDYQLKVYGTEFNLRNYADDSNIKVVLAKGSLGLIRGGKELLRMKPGEFVKINKNQRKIYTGETNVAIETAWRKNELIFDNTPFDEVVKYLERWYGVEISIKNEMKQKHNLTFKVKTETFRELMKLIQVMIPLEYKIDGKNITIKYIQTN